MKRKVTLMILAAVLLGPAYGMAEPRDGVGDISAGFGWVEEIPNWISSLFKDAAAAEDGPVHFEGWGGEGAVPMSDQGTTWDANGK